MFKIVVCQTDLQCVLKGFPIAAIVDQFYRHRLKSCGTHFQGHLCGKLSYIGTKQKVQAAVQTQVLH